MLLAAVRHIVGQQKGCGVPDVRLGVWKSETDKNENLITKLI